MTLPKPVKHRDTWGCWDRGRLFLSLNLMLWGYKWSISGSYFATRRRKPYANGFNTGKQGWEMARNWVLRMQLDQQHLKLNQLLKSTNILFLLSQCDLSFLFLAPDEFWYPWVRTAKKMLTRNQKEQSKHTLHYGSHANEWCFTRTQ